MPAKASFWTCLFTVATGNAFWAADFFSYVKPNRAHLVAFAAADADFTFEGYPVQRVFGCQCVNRTQGADRPAEYAGNKYCGYKKHGQYSKAETEETALRKNSRCVLVEQF